MASPSKPQPVIRFGAFEFDIAAGELFKDGAKLKLHGQPLAVLAALLEHPGEVVTREQLRERLWPGDTFVEFEHSLNAAVMRLREALGDTATEPHLIETVPRRGYRFIGPDVREMAVDDRRQRLQGLLRWLHPTSAEGRAMAGLAPPNVTRLGHYCLTEKIGEGAMGLVYRARDEHLECDVALKVLPPGVLHDEHTRKRFRKEALTLSKLNHPNIATVHDFDSDADVDFLVMEYIPGETISEKLAGGELPQKEVARLGAQIAEGLAAAHAAGVIHRDLKPANMRLTADGRLKILDFGLARLVQTGDPDATASESQVRVAGTLPYMAPEQLCNEELDARTDIWSAGVVLYEMATGELPFTEPGVKVVDSILHAAPPRPTALKPRLSPALEGIVLKCLEKDPEARYQSARELLVDLRRLAAPNTVTRAPVQRRPGRIASVAAVVLAVAFVAVAGWKIYEWLRHPPSPPRGPQTVAVLYFQNHTGDPSLGALEDVLTDSVGANLTRIPDMEVISTEALRNAFHRIRKNRPSITLPDVPQEVARAVGCSVFITGQILTVGAQRYVSVKMTQTDTGRYIPLSTERFVIGASPTDLSKILMPGNLVDSMTADIAHAIVPARKVAGNELAVSDVSTENYLAYEHFLQGRAKFAANDYSAAITELQKATNLDPQFALAYYWQAWSHMNVGETREAERLLRTLEAFQSRLSPRDQLQLQMTRANLSGDIPATRALLERLLKQSPRDVGTRYTLAYAMFGWGEYDRAVAVIQDGLKYDPAQEELWNTLAYAEALRGNREQALAASDKDAKLAESDNFTPLETRGDIYYILGQYAEAQARYQELVQRKPHHNDYYGYLKLAIATAAQNRRTEADAALRNFGAHAGPQFRIYLPIFEGQVMQTRGNIKGSLTVLRHAINTVAQSGQDIEAGNQLERFSILAAITGNADSALGFARRLQLGGEQWRSIALLQLAEGDQIAFEATMKEHVSAHPWLTQEGLQLQRAGYEMLSAAIRGDAQTVLRVSSDTPDIELPSLLFARGMAYMRIGNNEAAGQYFRRLIKTDGCMLVNQSGLRSRTPLLVLLAHFYLGRVFDSAGRHDQGRDEFQFFMAQAGNSPDLSKQIAEAKAALNH